MTRRCIYCYIAEGQPHTLICPTRHYPHLAMGCYGPDPQALGALNQPAQALAAPPPPASFVNSNAFRTDLARLLAEHGLHRATGVRPSTLVQLLVGVLSTLADIEADRQRGREVRMPPFPTLTDGEC